MSSRFLTQLAFFWKQFPFLAPALAVFLGSSFALSNGILYVFAFLALFVSTLKGKRCFLCLLIFLTSIFITHARYSFPGDELHQSEGIAKVSWSKLSEQRGPFSSQWVYEGTLLSFHSADGFCQGIPCKSYSPKKYPINNLDTVYTVPAKAILTKQKSLFLKIRSQAPWRKDRHAVGFAQWRLEEKGYFKTYLQEHYSNKRVASFLYGITCGEFSDPVLSYHFKKLGLQHILAISGFHFSIVAFFLGFFIQRLFPNKIAIALILSFLGAYFIFLGPSPSIQRAWLTITLGLLGSIFNLSAQPLNILGLCLALLTIINPFLTQTLGFKLSFLATASILLFYHPLECMLSYWWKAIDWKEAQEHSLLKQHALFVICMIKKALALSLSAHILTLPLIISIFHEWSPFSLLFNLVLPFAFGIGICLLGLGTLIGILLPILGIWVHSLNGYWIALLLHLTFIPSRLIPTLKVPSFPSSLVCICLVFMFFCAAFIQIKYKAPLFNQSI